MLQDVGDGSGDSGNPGSTEGTVSNLPPGTAIEVVPEKLCEESVLKLTVLC
jgi:hypothetical protein